MHEGPGTFSPGPRHAPSTWRRVGRYGVMSTFSAVRASIAS